MLILYRKLADNYYFWRTWQKDFKTGIIHWGKVGTKGQLKQVKSGILTNYQKKVNKEIKSTLKDGYSEFNADNFKYLEIEYTINNFGTDEDLSKRHRLEYHLDEILSWTGLGHTNGGSFGSGTMEVGCSVIDFEIAKKVIEGNLKNTEFNNYSRIFSLGNK